eukprot:2691989-Amphidinium_carterae.1
MGGSPTLISKGCNSHKNTAAFAYCSYNTYWRTNYDMLLKLLPASVNLDGTCDHVRCDGSVGFIVV